MENHCLIKKISERLRIKVQLIVYGSISLTNLKVIDQFFCHAKICNDLDKYIKIILQH